MTDQDHIDALSEPVRDAWRRIHFDAENCPFATAQIAVADIALIPKPSPKRDPVEELAETVLTYAENQNGNDCGEIESALRYLIKRGLLTLPEGGA